MRLFTLLLFLLSISLSAQNLKLQDSPTRVTCTEGGCIVNAGQDQVICSDGELVLRGENSEDFALPLNAFWEAAPGNPTGLSINDPTSLVTNVSAAGGTYSPGTYTFSLTVTCADGSTSCSETSVTVVELPDIELIVPQTPECSNTVFLARSGELPEGVTEDFFLIQSTGTVVEEVDNGFRLTRSANSSCLVRFSYTVFAGGVCQSVQIGEVQLARPHQETILTVPSITCDGQAITGSISVSASNFGCTENTILVVETPPGVEPADVVFTTISNSNFNFMAPTGSYTFEVTVTDVCGTSTSSITVACPEIDCRLETATGGYNRYVCNDFGTEGAIQLAAPHFDDASYEWSINNIPSWLTAELSTNGSVAYVTLTGSRPAGNFDNRIGFDVTVTDNLNPECDPVTLRSRLLVPAPFVTISDRINFNCGVGSVYSVSDNMRVNPRGYTFRVLESPDGYEGLMSGNLGFESDLLLLTQFGTYVIEISFRGFSFDYVLNTSVNCPSPEIFTIVVDDIPNIDAGSDAIICDDNIQLNGSTPRNAAGLPVDINILWEPVEDYPGVTISDVAIRNPVVTGLEEGQSYTFRYAFPGDPNCEKEDLVTITVREECNDTPELTCDLTLESRCTRCGCGEDVFVATAYDSNGDRLDVDVWDIQWFIDGELATTGAPRNYITRHYEGPTTVTIIARTELANGQLCTLERSIAVNCAGDCPILSFEYDNKSCEKDYFYGDVTIVDQAGNPVVFAGFDWYSDGSYDDNPYMLFSEPGEVVPVTVSFYSPYRCEVQMEFEPNCFSGDDDIRRTSKQGHAGHTTLSPFTSVYPNPADHNGPVTVQFGEHLPVSLSILDLSGREVFQAKLQKDVKEYLVSPASLPTGVMIVVLRDAAGKALDTQRFVVR